MSTDDNNHICFDLEKLTMNISMKSQSLTLYQNRLDTFKEWPKQLRPKPDKLARAGLTYTGRGDRVKCFSCNIELLNWNCIDDPFIEHYKHSKSCPYLKICYLPTNVENEMEHFLPFDQR